MVNDNTKQEVENDKDLVFFAESEDGISYIKVWHNHKTGFRTECNDLNFAGMIIFDMSGEIDDLQRALDGNDEQ